MKTKEYYLKIDAEINTILITGVTSNSVSIDFSGDIDFTRLVNELTQSIDSKMKLIPNRGNDTSEESNVKLILETIYSIIEEYNKTIAALDDADNEDELIDSVDVIEDNVNDEVEDLPF